MPAPLALRAVYFGQALGFLIITLLLVIFPTYLFKSLNAPLTGASLMNLGGFSAFSWGAMTGSVSVVTVISTLSGGIAAILGFVFFKERLSAVQVLGVVWVLVGAVVLHTAHLTLRAQKSRLQEAAFSQQLRLTT